MSEHTPTPWRVQQEIQTGFQRARTNHWMLYSEKSGRDFHAGEASNGANATFIVRAANAHDALVKLAHRIVASMECARFDGRTCLDVGFAPEDCCRYCHARAALTLAETA